MTTPRVTIGVPVFNEERYLAETLDSLLAQEFDDFEIVIADNASTDATPDICAAYAELDPRVRCVRADENAGAARNYNWLVELARAPYFKWASGNDLVRSTLLGDCIAVLDERPDVVLAYPRTSMIDEDGQFIRDHEDRLHIDHDAPWDRLRHFVHNRHLCNPCFGVIRTDVLRRTRQVRPGISSDISLLGELALAGKFHEVPDHLFLRRVLPDSCGLGDLTDTEVAAWFDPSRTRRGLPPQARIFFEIEGAILTYDMPMRDRLRTAGVFGYTWVKNRVAVNVNTRRHRRTLGRAGGVVDSSPKTT